MGDPITRDEWNRLIQTVDRGFEGLNNRLDRLNGRMGDTEQEVAVLKDRSDDTVRQRWIDRGVGTLIAGMLGIKEFWFR